jgi:hypothetical protein
MAQRAARAMADNEGRCKRTGDADVGWVLLEIVAALAIAIGIVWWTFPRSRKPPRADEPPRE